MSFRFLHIRAMACVVAAMLNCIAAFAFAADDSGPQRIELHGISNAFRLTPRIFSGSQPEGDAAFAALEDAGVKTILSVDGAKPDVAAAKKHGMRYVHLPLGYDGISPQRVAELVKAATPDAGKIFIHCHHGLHRGPAASGVICEALEGWTPAQAGSWLKQAGTAADYPGLHRAVREFRAPTPEEIARVGELAETAKTPTLVDAMVAADALFDHLKAQQAAGWDAGAGNPARQPAHVAVLLREQFREIARTEDAAKRGDDFRRRLAESEKSAAILCENLRATPRDRAALDAAMKSAAESCAACHRAFRNERNKKP